MLNNVQIIGRLGRDPEMRFTTTGKAVCSFSVATDSGYGEKKTTEWFRCTAWEKTAELVSQYLSKGSLVYCQGRLQTRKYQDKTGAERYSTELIVNEVKFLSPKSEGAARGGGDTYDGVDPDDLPFE